MQAHAATYINPEHRLRKEANQKKPILCDSIDMEGPNRLTESQEVDKGLPRAGGGRGRRGDGE